MPLNENLYDGLSMPELIDSARRRSSELHYASRLEREGAFKVNPDLIRDSMLFERLAQALEEK